MTALHIGSGPSAADFLAAYVRSPHVDRVVLAAADGEERQALRRRFGIIKALRDDYREALDDPALPLVSLSVPLAEQPALAIEALQAGKDVLCAGPLAPTLAEAEAMLNAAEQAGKRLLGSLHEPVMPAHVKAKALFAAGEIGRVALVTILVLASEPPPEPLEGLIQPVALLQHLFGPAAAVTATGDARVMLLGLEFTGGVRGHVTLCHAAVADRPTSDRRLVADVGSLLIRDNPEDEWPLVFLSADDFRPIKVKNPPDIQAWARLEMAVHLVDCLVAGREPLVPVGAAREALATALAAIASAREGRRVVLADPPPPGSDQPCSE